MSFSFLKLNMKRLAFIFLVAVSCKTAHVSLQQDFATSAESYEVQGKNGWQVNQVINFGPYETSKIDRSMTFSYLVPFLVDFSGGKESLAFNIVNKEAGAGVNFLGDSRLKDNHLSLAKGYFQIPLKQKDVFAGAIYFSQPGLQRFDFLLLNPNNQQLTAKCQGVVLDEKGDEYFTIKGITKLQGSKIPQTQAFGYEFLQGDKVVGAVETLNKGRVWFDTSLSERDRLLLSSLATGLLVRNNLQEEVENL